MPAVLASFLLLGSLWAQDATPSSDAKSASSQTATEQNKTNEQNKASEPSNQSGGGANDSIAMILEQTSERGAHSAEKWGRKLGIGPYASFAISLALNFAGVALFFYILFRSSLPKAFRDRTEAIRKGIREAQAASAEATRRLTDIEERLSKLDNEIAAIRSTAEQESAQEENRIHVAAEEDTRKVLEAAETEITAIARNARRELKAYAADLAVDLASRRIHVDDSSDKALVRDFVDQLGRDGR